MSWTTINASLSEGVQAASKSIVGVRSAGRGPISGVVWDPSHVLTVGRVGREERTAVRAPDGDLREARVVARAQRLGLAMLAVEGEPLTPARWTEEAPRVGHIVVATGRVRGRLRASLGMVAGVGGAWRTRWGGRVDAFIDVDGGLPPGGSGGGLVGPGGALVGLNTAGLVRGGTTLPAMTVARVAKRLLGGEGGRRAYLGASFIPVALPAALQASEGRDRALLAVAIEPGGPSERAGLALGDVLLALDEHTFEGLPDLFRWLGSHAPGEPTTMRLLRGGSEQTLELIPAARGE